MLHPDNEIIGFIAVPGPGIQDAESPGTGLTMQAGAAQDRDRHPVLQADPAGIEELGPLGGPEIEDPARLQKELPLLRKEHRETGQVDHLAVRFDLGEIRVDREVRREGG